MTRRLGIHVLGPGYGESLLIQFPDRSFGVVDCFKTPATAGKIPPVPSTAAIPTVSLLRSLAGGEVPRVRFVALTHPHADHIIGLGALIAELRPEEIWLSHGVFAPALLRIFGEILRQGHESTERSAGVDRGAIARELAQIGDLVRKRTYRPRRFSEHVVLSSDADEVEIRCLTPNDSRTMRFDVEMDYFARRLREAFDAHTATGKALSFPLNLNLISGSMLLKFGATAIVLGGDAESPLWREFLDDCSSRSTLSLPPRINLLKVPHHGSANGLPAALFDSGIRTEMAVLTPFTRHKLPTSSGLAELLKRIPRIYSTNSWASAEVSATRWNHARLEPPEPRFVPPFSAAFASVMAESGFFRSGVSPASSDRQAVALRASGVAEVMRRGLIGEVSKLRALSNVQVRAPVENIYRVSLFFDQTGACGEPELGGGAGQLADPRDTH